MAKPVGIPTQTHPPQSPAPLDSRAERAARLLDEGYPLPLIRLRMPVDPFLGLIPVVGDVAALFIGISLVAIARQRGAPARMQVAMASNLALDTIVGSVPVVGDVFDFFFKANRRNLRLLSQLAATKQQSSAHAPIRTSPVKKTH